MSEQSKASIHRREDAGVLLDGGRWRGAMYVAGYAVDCLLKAQLMRKFGMPTLAGLESELVMADQQLKDKIYDLLKRNGFGDSTDLVDVSDGPAGDVHVVVVSRKFDGRLWRERREMVEAVLDRELSPEESGQVSLAVTASPEQVKAV